MYDDSFLESAYEDMHGGSYEPDPTDDVDFPDTDDLALSYTGPTFLESDS